MALHDHGRASPAVQERWTGLQADYDLRRARYETATAIERQVVPLADLVPVPA